MIVLLVTNTVLITVPTDLSQTLIINVHNKHNMHRNDTVPLTANCRATIQPDGDKMHSIRNFVKLLQNSVVDWTTIPLQSKALTCLHSIQLSTSQEHASKVYIADIPGAWTPHVCVSSLASRSWFHSRRCVLSAIWNDKHNCHAIAAHETEGFILCVIVTVHASVVHIRVTWRLDRAQIIMLDSIGTKYVDVSEVNWNKKNIVNNDYICNFNFSLPASDFFLQFI